MNPTLALSRDFELIQLFDGLDYDEVWIGKHHPGGFGTFLCFANNFAPWQATKRSCELLARCVKPPFKGFNVARESNYTAARAAHGTVQTDFKIAVTLATAAYLADRDET